MSILEDLWFDNLVVQDAEIRKGSEQEKALAASVRCEDALRETLTEKQKEQFALCGERRNGRDDQCAIRNWKFAIIVGRFFDAFAPLTLKSPNDFFNSQ